MHKTVAVILFNKLADATLLLKTPPMAPFYGEWRPFVAYDVFTDVTIWATRVCQSDAVRLFRVGPDGNKFSFCIAMPCSCSVSSLTALKRPCCGEAWMWRGNQTSKSLHEIQALYMLISFHFRLQVAHGGTGDCPGTLTCSTPTTLAFLFFLTIPDVHQVLCICYLPGSISHFLLLLKHPLPTVLTYPKIVPLKRKAVL